MARSHERNCPLRGRGQSHVTYFINLGPPSTVQPLENRVCQGHVLAVFKIWHF